MQTMFGGDVLPALKKAAKLEGVTVGALTRRIRREYQQKLGGRIPAWLRNECYGEYLKVRTA